MTGRRVVILGAGVSGLGAGRQLARAGYDVVVLEKEGWVGGLSATFRRSGYAFDYGPHNFHSYLPEVEDFVFRELGVAMERKSSQSAMIQFRGRAVPYPIKGLKALTVLDPLTALRGASDFFFSRFKLRLGNPGETSFEDWIVHRYGRTLYRIYFGPYAEKVWGLPGGRIDLLVASKRVPTASLLELLIRAVFRTGPRRSHSEDTETVRSYYPQQGIGVVSEALAAGIREAGGRILLNATPQRIQTRDGRATSVEYLCENRPGTVSCDALINTIPLNEFTSRLGADLPAAPLRFRSMALLYLLVDRPRVFDVPWMYFSDPDDPNLVFNRIYEVGNFSRQMTPPGKSLLCLEITCRQGDALWQAEPAALAARCAGYLERRGFFRRAEVEEFFVKRLPVAYPVFELGYRRSLARHLAQVERFANVATLGRQGAFTYTNVDHCLGMALLLESHVRKNPDFALAGGFRAFHEELGAQFG